MLLRLGGTAGRLVVAGVMAACDWTGFDLTSISLSSRSASFAAHAGDAPPPPQVLQIANGGFGDLTRPEVGVEASGSARWLRVSLSSEPPWALTLGVDPEGLPPGTYGARVTIVSAGALNSPQELPVVLVVRPRRSFLPLPDWHAIP